MRLICGLVRLDGAPADPATLAAMMAALTAPGLSLGVTLRVEGPAALAVLDFAAPTEAAAAPLPSDPGGLWLAADLRLDRPAELARALGVPAATTPENLVLAGLRRWDADLPDRLDGDFALAAWDPARRRLLCARDIMGVRPLCYAHRPGRWFAFASLPKGLHGSGVASPDLDPVALGRLLVEHYARGPGTGYRDIAWLPAGHSLVVTADALHLHRAWRPDPAAVGRWRGTARAAAETLRALTREAVACRLPPDGPVAAHLSGGLDSSAVAVLATRALRPQGRRLHGFSQLAGPSPGGELRDERDYVGAVLAQEPDIAWRAFQLPPVAESGAIDADLPGGGPGVASDDAMCAAAAVAGARVLLSGAGGDEGATYNAADVHAAMLLQGRWRWLPADLCARARRQGRPLPAVVLDRLLRPLLPDRARSLARRLRRRPGLPDRTDPLALLAEPLRLQVAAALAPIPAMRNRPADRIWSLADSYLAGRATRWAILGARHGVAFSFPLADRRILDFSLSLPLERLVDGGWQRQPFRNAMAGILPETIRWRETKYAAFPDLPLLLAAAKGDLLARIQALRRNPAVAAFLDLDAVAAAIRSAPEGDDAVRLAEGFNAGGRRPAELQRALDALRALMLARHLERFG